MAYYTARKQDYKFHVSISESKKNVSQTQSLLMLSQYDICQNLYHSLKAKLDWLYLFDENEITLDLNPLLH